jgi:hypothetical protein
MSPTDQPSCPDRYLTDLDESSVTQFACWREDLTADEYLSVIHSALDRNARLYELTTRTTPPRDTGNKAALARRVTSAMGARRELVHLVSRGSRKLHRSVGNGTDPSAYSRDDLDVMTQRINTMPQRISRRDSAWDRCNAAVITLTLRTRQDKAG